MHNEAVNRLDFITGRDADQGRLRARHGRDRRAARRLEDRAAQAQFRIQHPRQARRDELPAQSRGRGPDRHRAALCRQRSGRPARQSLDRGGAAQFARREGAVPRLGGAGQVQREFAVPAPTTRAALTRSPRPPRFAARQDGFSHGFSATAFFTASTMPSGGSIFTSSGLPVSSTLLRLERIAGQPVRPPCRISSGMSHDALPSW